MFHHKAAKYFGSYIVTIILAQINKEFIIQKHVTARITTNQYSFYNGGNQFNIRILTGAVGCYS